MKCTRLVEIDLKEIIAKAPRGLWPMFKVTGISSKHSEWLLNECVYIKNGHVEDCMTGEHISADGLELQFITYSRD